MGEHKRENFLNFSSLAAKWPAPLSVCLSLFSISFSLLFLSPLSPSFCLLCLSLSSLPAPLFVLGVCRVLCLGECSVLLGLQLKLLQLQALRLVQAVVVGPCPGQVFLRQTSLVMGGENYITNPSALQKEHPKCAFASNSIHPQKGEPILL